MKLTLKNIRELKARTPNKLEKYVYSYIIDRWHEYNDKCGIFTDVLTYGCQSGIVSSLIYYSDTIAFYHKYGKEINDLLHDIMYNTGIYDPVQLFGDNWDEEDPLAHNVQNQNLLAWFGFEETLRNIAYDFEELNDKI